MKWLILAFAAGLMYPLVYERGDLGTKFVAASVQIENLNRVLERYRSDTGDYPSTEPGLQALRDSGAEGWQGPYLTKAVPLDPWGRAYHYRFPGGHGDRPDVWSLGSDGLTGGYGPNADIVSWSLKTWKVE